MSRSGHSHGPNSRRTTCTARKGANGLAGDGRLEPRPAEGGAADSYTYDPAKPVPTGAVRRLLAHAGGSSRRAAAAGRARLHIRAVDRAPRGDRANSARALHRRRRRRTRTSPAAISDVYPDGTRARAHRRHPARAVSARAAPRRSCLTPGHALRSHDRRGRDEQHVPAADIEFAWKCRAATSRATTGIPTPARRSDRGHHGAGPAVHVS